MKNQYLAQFNGSYGGDHTNLKQDLAKELRLNFEMIQYNCFRDYAIYKEMMTLLQNLESIESFETQVLPRLDTITQIFPMSMKKECLKALIAFIPLLICLIFFAKIFNMHREKALPPSTSIGNRWLSSAVHPKILPNLRNFPCFRRHFYNSIYQGY